MSPNRRLAAVAGAMYLVSHVTSIGALALYGPALHDPDLMHGGGTEPVLVGALLETVLAVSLIGTAVALFPLVRRAGEAAALAYSALRTLEAAIVLAGVVPMLALVALVRAGEADPRLEGALVAMHDATFLLGPGLVCAVDTAVLAGLLLRSRQVPRAIPVLGLVGAPLLLVVGAAELLGAVPQYSALTAVPAVPVFAWEVSLAVVLLARGLRDQPATSMRSVPITASSSSARADSLPGGAV